MGFQSGINKSLAAVAAGAAMIKGESDKKVAAAEALESEKVSLAAEDASLSEKEFSLKNEKEEADKAVTQAQANLDKVLPDDKGKYRDEKGRYMGKEAGKERETVAAKELEKRKEALSVLMKKINAVNVQRADWKRRVGGLR